MYRFLLRPRWIGFTLLMALLVVVMVNLAFWQLRRLDERRDRNHTMTVRSEEQVKSLDEVLAEHPDPADAQWRPAQAVGVYEPEGQVLIRDRSLDGVAGFNVVTPLRLDDGRFLTVERGFIPAIQEDTPPAPPAGRVLVDGRLRASQVKRHSWEKADPKDGVLTKLNRVDVERFDQQVDGDAVPMFIELTASDPPDPGVEPIPLPPRDDGPHLSYAGQWLLFSALTVVAWVLVVRNAAAKRRKSAAAAASTLERGHPAEELHDVG